MDLGPRPESCKDVGVGKVSPVVRWAGVCIDCSDAEGLAEFYCRLLGWEIVARDGGWLQLRGPDPGLVLNIEAEEWYRPPTWPEQTGGLDKMMHFEIEVSDLEAAISLAVAAGGRPAGAQPTDRDPARIRVMLDPAGHPFCLFVAGE
jgi:catechol 2,3-dioxygenase-like lactoylglutathione lyase family enzyme